MNDAKIIDLDELMAIIDEELSRIDEDRKFFVALDGGSASGKSTMAEELEAAFSEKVKTTVLHMDDFFLRPEQRTEERYDEPGGNVDRERFLEEVLLPLSKGKKEILYRPLDCSTFTISQGEIIHPGKLIIVEGAYSHHPELRDYFDMLVYLDIDPDLQRERIKRRNKGEQQELFFSKWIPLENKYFEVYSVKSNSQYIILIKP